MTLEPGMVYAPGKMTVHEENIVIRHDGPELLSRKIVSSQGVNEGGSVN